MWLVVSPVTSSIVWCYGGHGCGKPCQSQHDLLVEVTWESGGKKKWFASLCWSWKSCRVTLGTNAHDVINAMKSSFSFACSEKCPTCFWFASYPSFMSVLFRQILLYSTVIQVMLLYRMKTGSACWKSLWCWRITLKGFQGRLSNLAMLCENKPSKSGWTQPWQYQQLHWA